MLKIAEYRNVLGEDGKSIRREKIHLKELEKFGFLSDHYGNYTIFNDYNIDVITVWNDRTMDIDGDSIAISTLYDLIKADLVEKV